MIIQFPILDAKYEYNYYNYNYKLIIYRFLFSLCAVMYCVILYQITLPKQSSVQELKARASELFGLDLHSCLDNARLRLGETRGEKEKTARGEGRREGGGGGGAGGSKLFFQIIFCSLLSTVNALFSVILSVDENYHLIGF